MPELPEVETVSMFTFVALPGGEEYLNVCIGYAPSGEKCRHLYFGNASLGANCMHFYAVHARGDAKCMHWWIGHTWGAHCINFILVMRIIKISKSVDSPLLILHSYSRGLDSRN